MRHVVKVVGLAAFVALGLGAAAAPAAAQGFSVRIGPDRPYVERRVYRGPRVIERRVVRSRRVCRTEIRTHIRPNGVVVRRPVEVCTTRRY
jgi:hypothetical protein